MTSGLRIFEYAFALLGLSFMSGTLSSFLAEPGAVSAPLVQVAGGAIGLFSVVAILATRGALMRIMGTYWPVLLPVGLAALSLAWSEDASLTIRRAAALGLTTAFGFWLALRFSPRELFVLVVTMSAVVVVANFIEIKLNPARGIHQIDDEINAQHAGAWRGLFGHKNDFGRLIALCTATLLAAFMFRIGGRSGRLVIVGLLGLAYLLIAKSSSSQATLLSAAVPASILVLMAMRSMSPQARSILMMIALPAAAVAAVSAQLIFVYVLGLLGRDATLTGRTDIWEGVLLAMQNNALFGGGYGAGWQVVGPRLTALTGIEVGHAHNGYLDLAVDIGFFGLGMTLFLMFWLGAMAFRNLMMGILPQISLLALAVLLFSLIGNVAGSFLLLHNSLYWVLTVTTFCQLRDAPLASSARRRDYAGSAGRQTADPHHT